MGDKHRILIVDDDMISLAVLEDTLSKYETVALTCGEDVFPALLRFKPELILLDVNMPGMSGYEVCRAVRAEEGLSFVRIILVSGNMSVEERLRGYDAGADDYIVKPFSPDELKAKVDVFLKLKNEEEVDETKSNLLGLFTHETRTPLGVIIGLSDLLRIDDARDTETRRCAQAIYENAVELHRFIEKATLLSRLKCGYVPMRSFDLLDIHMDRIIRRVEPIAQDKQITLTLKTTGDFMIMADWEILDEALTYVVENAVKFSDAAGEVVISIRGATQRLEITVSDTGRGIGASWITNIFEEFAVRDLSHHHRGQGLSLAVVKKVITLHDGTIEAKSRVGEGSVFTICLPMLNPADGPDSSNVS